MAYVDGLPAASSITTSDLVLIAQNGSGTPGSAITRRAPISMLFSSPALTGSPTAPTPSPNNNSHLLANTEFVVTAVAGATTAFNTAITTETNARITQVANLPAILVSSFNSRVGNITLSSADVVSALTYTPYSATNPAGYQTAANVASSIAASSSNYVLPTATTSILGGVKVDGSSITITNGVITSRGALASDALPLTSTTASAGVSLAYSRADHIHPTDTTRYAASNPANYIAASGAPVQSVAGRTGVISLAVADISGAAPLASPTFTGTVTIPAGAAISGYLTTTAAASTYQTTLGFTPYNSTNPSGFQTAANVASSIAAAAYVLPTATTSILGGVKIDGSTITIASGVISATAPSNATPSINGAGTPGVALTYSRSDHIHPTDSTRAPLANPIFTGIPRAPTAASSDQSTQLATTAYVTTAIGNIVSGVSSVVGQTGNITLSQLVASGVAPLNANVVILTSGSTYSCTGQEAYVIVKKTVPSSTIVTLPSSPATGQIINIKDGDGTATSFRITINAAPSTVDGGSTVVMDQPYQSTALLYNGQNWNVV